MYLCINNRWNNKRLLTVPSTTLYDLNVYFDISSLSGLYFSYKIYYMSNLVYVFRSSLQSYNKMSSVQDWCSNPIKLMQFVIRNCAVGVMCVSQLIMSGVVLGITEKSLLALPDRSDRPDPCTTPASSLIPLYMTSAWFIHTL